MDTSPYTSPQSQADGETRPKRSWQGTTSLALGSLASVLLLFAASHVRVDRSMRIPVVTYVGPAAAWVMHLAIAGWILSFIALVVASEMLRQKERHGALAVLTVLVCAMNFFGSFVFIAAVEEN